MLKDHISWDQNIKDADIYETLDEQVKVTSVKCIFFLDGDEGILSCNVKGIIKKSRIRATPNLSTDADRSTDTN